MCGIVGYVGPNADGKALDVVMEGLARLEYRGYDSAGVALVTRDGVASEKRAGKLVNLQDALDAHHLPGATTGIGHTRWATHGGPTDQNAHPHRAGEDGKLALIHNGIIENFHQLKKALLAEGASFTSETDTEVVAPGRWSASSASWRLTSLPARFSLATPSSVTSATPAESYPRYSRRARPSMMTSRALPSTFGPTYPTIPHMGGSLTIDRLPDGIRVVRRR